METEVKLRIDRAAAWRRRLARLGFAVKKRRLFEVNTIFDTAGNALRRRRKLLRLRQAGPVSTITFKGPPDEGPYKSRPEIETEVADAGATGLILQSLGFAPVFRYEKYRTEYAKPRQAGSIMLDETPIGDFLELEGSPGWIDRTARALGRSTADYITDSYGALYLKHCADRGEKPGNMVFG